jgi:hypothetical protein
LKRAADLRAYEGLGTLFYGMPIHPSNLEPVQMPDGRDAIALRPSMPRNFNADLGKFEPHSDRLVVCATSVATIAVFHALSAAAADQVQLPPEYRRRGAWIGDSGEIVMATTQAVIDCMRDTTAYVCPISEDGFSPFSDGAPYEYRSEVPVEVDPDLVAEVFGESDWPEDVIVVEPYKFL